ncbi:putative peptidoglycan glycosyltransferase FtsW [BD1-7 clade bacterium]|uniref:Probable peptidoglycan glycosyltransferase FtsW n=1 Tax=BD1-7 clade bacterium TaxID=2029982 RepID=A0A5S9Q8G7_9GAMM|nr:putative peptidoglycan glycosyltransferase FtsW [BD1-7 clade bacterium]CAA0115261.1 putative peptidoglycan glycosyltransferase FtsW [BD1-7 clade bacterium]
MLTEHFRFVDRRMLVLVGALASMGLIMMGSASIDYAAHKYGAPHFYIGRQFVFLVLASVAGVAAFMVPTKQWYRFGWLALLMAFALLIAVLIPGIGREVNGSMRWIPLGPVNLQSSEVAKLFILIYMAGYLVRRQDEVRERWVGFLKPIAVLMIAIVLLLKEPDFGSAVVIIFACLGMIFLAGLGLPQLAALVVASLASVVLMAVSSSYRMQRLKCFVDPWQESHRFDCGYQLTQSLIAFGRGEWLGLGLGNSIQKQFFLPEAHTDFVFAIIAEELGFLGSLFTLCLFSALIVRIFRLAKQVQEQGELFNSYLASGIGLVFSAQIFINIGVNIGLLPTKGLTLPFLSYGGSSLIVSFMMVGILARIQAEVASKGAVSSRQNEKGRRLAT